ncbi:MAG: serine hydrolase [Spirochaetales bacterium]|nr:serine hydrolase [Spirochaetales bacterium]
MKNSKIWKHKYLLLTASIILVTVLLTVIDFPVARHNDTEDFISFLDKKIPRYMSKYDVGAAAVGLVQNGEIVCLKGYGYSDEQKTIPVTPETIFQAGSVSKPVTACGIMKLVEDGIISLDTTVESRLKRWQLPKSDFDETGVTVRRLLSHTAGIANVGGCGNNSLRIQKTVNILKVILPAGLC